MQEVPPGRMLLGASGQVHRRFAIQIYNRGRTSRVLVSGSDIVWVSRNRRVVFHQPSALTPSMAAGTCLRPVSCLTAAHISFASFFLPLLQSRLLFLLVIRFSTRLAMALACSVRPALINLFLRRNIPLIRAVITTGSREVTVIVFFG